MAYFAKLNSENKVIEVIRVNNEVITDSNGIEQESLGVNFLNSIFNDTTVTWKKTSYNTKNGKYYNQDGTEGDQSKAFRVNYAIINGTYDPSKDAFIGIQHFPSWVLNENTCNYEAPIPYPKDGNEHFWNESLQVWE